MKHPDTSNLRPAFLHLFARRSLLVLLVLGSHSTLRAGDHALPLASFGPLPSVPASSRCSTPETAGDRAWTARGNGHLGVSDCPLEQTNPGRQYEPGERYSIQVVVHVIMNSTCTDGVVSDETVQSQIDILNEDFLALPGTPGAPGADTAIEFALAEVDPDGLPTTGITRSCNTTWYNDTGSYWESLAWDPHRYLNLYTNTAANARGYVPFLPADGGGVMVGGSNDRVVVNWLVFGRDSPFPPHDQGRTATHEVGHFLGLFHTYFEGCGTATEPLCYSTGDRLCDTPPNAMSHDECPVGATSCGGVPVPIENYMELTDDLCMTGFTFEQAQRMRCTLLTYRPDLFRTGLFADGFESGDTSAWSSTVP